MYRIMFNSTYYKVQKRKWFFFWKYVKSPFSRMDDLAFRKLEDAEDYVEKQEKEEAKYRKVTNRRQTKLYKATKGE